MNHTEVLNALIEKHKYESYLEIGVQNPHNNFNKIKCAKKVGVDPESNFEGSEYDGVFFQLTSNEYFRKTLNSKFNHDVRQFDLIFIDGLHHWEQALIDFLYSLQALRGYNGTIVMHDALPKTEIMQRVPRESSEWTGDVWKAIACITNIIGEHHKIYFQDQYVIDDDYGIAVFENIINTKFLEVNYEESFSWYKETINVIPPSKFQEICTQL